MTKRWAEEIQKLRDKGLSQVHISKEVGCHSSTVCRNLGGNFDAERWEAERIAAAQFFGSMTPQQEYCEHIKKRNEAREKFGEIE